MNADAIVTIYVVIDDILKVMQHQDDVRSKLSAAEILTVAIVAAQQFQNHHERALGCFTRLATSPGSVCRVSIAACTHSKPYLVK